MGVEPTIFRLEGGRVIHYATGALVFTYLRVNRQEGMSIQNPVIPTLYKYERFGPYIFTFPIGYQVFGNPLSNYRDGTFASNSSVLQQYCYYDSNASNVVFGGFSRYPNGIANATTAAGEQLQFLCQLSTDTTQIASNSPLTVVVGNGRFTFGGLTLSNQTLFVGQVYSNVIELNTANLAVTTVYSSPNLPIGMSFAIGSNGTQWFINGIPDATYAPASYQIIGTNAAGNVVTTTMTFRVLSPRIAISNVPSPSLTVNPQSSETFVITASGHTLVNPSNFQYVNLPRLPDGCSFFDPTKDPPVYLTAGSPFPPSDSNCSIGLSCIGTTSGAESVLGSGTFTANLRSTAGTLSNTTPIAFSYTEAVLFVGSIRDGASIDGLYTGVPIPNTYLLSALSFFPGTAVNANIQSMTSTTLPPGVSVTFNSITQRGFLTGTPTTAGTTTSTILATNTNDIVGEMTITITVAVDTITVAPAPGSSKEFIIGRSLSLDPPIVYTATSSANLPITSFTSSTLPSGIVVSNVGSNLTFSGVPTTLYSNTVTLTATDGIATGVSSLTAVVVDDTLTFDTLSTISLVQNIPMTPVRVRVNLTTSGLPILTYSSINMPLGLNLTSGGLIQGTPLVTGSRTANVAATTGYSTGSTPVIFAITADSMLFLLPNGNSYTWSNGLTVPVTAISYSQIPGSNFTLSLPTPYGLTITSGGVLGGTLTDSLPPNQVLPPTVAFTVGATAGSLTDSSLQFTLATQNALIGRTFLTGSAGLFVSDSTSNTFANPATWTAVANNTITDFKMKNMYVDCNVFLAATTALGTAPPFFQLYRSIDGNTFTLLDVPSYFQKITYDGTRWYAASLSNVYTSTDDGLTWTLLAGTFAGTPKTIRAVGGAVYVGTTVDLYAYPDRYGALIFEAESIGPTSAINVDLPGTILAGGASGLYFSSDGFEWNIVVPIAGLTGEVGFNSELLYGNGTFAFIGEVSGGYSVFYNTTGDALNNSNWVRDSKLVSGPLGFTSATGWSVADATKIYQTPGFPSAWSAGVLHGLGTIGPVLSPTVYVRPPGTTSFVTTLTRTLGPGPVFTLPTTQIYFFNLYLTIVPIQFVATNALYYFIDQTAIPLGMTFNALTATLSGTPMRILNNYSLTVFATDASGNISSFTLTLSVKVPYAGLPDLGNASSYTAYLRAQVLINGALRAINNEVYPGAPIVGPLMGPSPSPEVTNKVIPYCDPPE